MRPIRIFCETKAHKFYAGDNFWNIIGRQEMSPVAMFHNVLGRGFVIQQVILIFHQMILRPLGWTILHESNKKFRLQTLIKLKQL